MRFANTLLQSLLGKCDQSVMDDSWFAKDQKLKHHSVVGAGNGGWGDPRDVRLCLAIASGFKKNDDDA